MQPIAALIVSALLAQPGAYRIDPASSEAGFDLKATMHTVHGKTSNLSGEVRVTPAADGTIAVAGSIEIEAAALATGNKRRDATMREKSLAVAQFPTIVWTPERFTPSGPPDATGASAGSLTGQLTIRGRTRPHSMSVTFAARGNRIVGTGTFDVVWADFGIPDPSFAFIRIERVAHAHFRAEFIPLP